MSRDKVERRFDRMCATVEVTNLPTSKETSDFRSVWHRGSTPATKPLTVFRADLLGSAEASWEELFAGYTALKAITFSSSTEMIMRWQTGLST